VGPLWGGLVVGFFVLFATPTRSPGQRLIIEDETPPGGIFATVGLGVIDVEEGTGLGVPLGVTAISPRHRILATVNLFDLGLLQGTSENQRYRQYFDTRFGQQLCVDTTTNQLASFGRCAGDTNLLRSLSADLNFLPVQTVIVGSKPGSLHVGMGWRMDDPRTVYGTLGMFFPSHAGRSASVRLSMGKQYIFLGFSWGMNVRRALTLF
jgi:hypothetical protein